VRLSGKGVTRAVGAEVGVQPEDEVQVGVAAEVGGGEEEGTVGTHQAAVGLEDCQQSGYFELMGPLE
jgi:hypothetical protein